MEATADDTPKVYLTWDDESDNESGFEIERKIYGGSYSSLADVSANNQGYYDYDVTHGTEYKYRIRSYNGAGSSDWEYSSYVTVPSSNNDPILSNADHAPDSGDPSTEFTYTIKYQDSDGDMPSVKKVYINGTGFDMTQTAGTDPIVGIFYAYQTYGSSLNCGTNNYYFSFEDGNGGSDRDPSSGTHPGPDVSCVPSIELTLHMISDTTGTPHSDTPGNEQLYFDPGETMRVTLKARNTGYSNANANWVLNLAPSNDHGNVRFNSDPTPNNTNDKTIPNDGNWYYYSFDWTTDTDDPIGSYDILAAARSASDWNTILDDTEEGVNTTSLGPAAWLTECFNIGLPVVLVHGFGSNPSEPVADYWMHLPQLLQDDGFTVIRFDYRDDQNLWNDTRYGIEGIGMQFGLYIRSWCIDYKCPKLNVVAHSMGGLVVRSAMAEMGPVDPDHRESRISIVDYQGHIKRLLTLGTPHYGSPLAELRSILIDYFLDIPTGDVDYLRDEMEPGSRFVWDLRLYTEDNEAEIRDSEIVTVVGTSCIIQPFSYPSDCIVENISAAWKDWVGNSNIRVVDESHGGLKDIDTADEDVYKIVKSFCSSSSTWSSIGFEYTDNKAGMLARAVNSNTEEVLVADEFKLKNNAPISIWFSPGLNEREMGYECYYVPHNSIISYLLYAGTSQIFVRVQGFANIDTSHSFVEGEISKLEFQMVASGDSVLPTCNILQPNSGGEFAGTVSVAENANDNVGVQYVEFQYSTDHTNWYTLPVGSQDDPSNDARDWYSANGWGFDFDTVTPDAAVGFAGNLNAAQVWVRARALDTSGNLSAWDECDQPFMIDNEAPSFFGVWGSTDPPMPGTFEMRQTINDNLSGVHDDAIYPRFYYRWNNSTIDATNNDGIAVGSWDGSFFTAATTIGSEHIGDTIYWRVRALDNVDNESWSDTHNGGVIQITGTVSTPAFDPDEGTYTEPVNVTISCSTSGATIHYNTNGVDPTESDPVYSSPINIGTTSTLKARAWKAGWNPSGVKSADYTITGTVAAPTFDPDEGTYTEPVDVTISCSTPGATIHYTTNGVEPTEGDPVYSSPINISSTTTLKAKAWKSGWNPSALKSADYTITGDLFTDIGTPLTGLYSGSLSWGDYDNDGDLDLAIAGLDTGPPTYTRVSKIYRNDGSGVFTDIEAGLTGITACSISWGDYDNDGDLDLAMSGDSANGKVSKIYQNNGDSTFTDIEASLMGLNMCSLSWADYDNDGDLDLAIVGYASGTVGVSKIYRNDGASTFTDVGADLTVYVFSKSETKLPLI